MAAAGEVSRPPAGSFLAAYGEVLMAADTGRGAVGQGARHRTSAHGEAGTRLTPSLPWIGALPPCSPAKMQAGSLHSSVSYGASFGSHVTIRPTGLTREAGRVPWWRSSTNGHCRGTCAAVGSRTFVLDSRALVPHLHHGGPGDLVGQYAGGEGVLPRSPFFVGWPNRTAHMGRRRLEDGGHQGPRALPWQTGLLSHRRRRRVAGVGYQSARQMLPLNGTRLRWRSCSA